MTLASDLAERFWVLRMEHDHATALWEGELEHIELWPDLAPEAIEDLRGQWLEIADAAGTVGPDATLGERITASTVKSAAEVSAAAWEAMPEIEAHNPSMGALGLIQAFIARYTLPTEEYGRRYLQKLRNSGPFLDDLAETLERGAGSGLTLVDIHARTAIGALDRILATDVSDDPTTSQAAPVGGVSWDWTASVQDVVRDEMRPAMARYRDALERVALPAARSSDRPGLCHVPDGAEMYARKLRGYTTLDVTADEVHRRGLEQIARLEEEYSVIGEEAFGLSDPSEVYERIRSDSSLHYHDVETLIADATEMFQRARDTAPSYFTVTPMSDCDVRPVTVGSMAFYSGPNPVAGKPASFYFNVTDPSAWGPQLAATTFHEGIPGHHFDLARSIENTHLLDLHRKMYIAAYNEGWALYSERVADEMGLYRTPVERLGMLMGDSLRAGRLVVDTGMHALGWTRDQAIAYLLDNSPLPEAEVVPEVDRYIGAPGQACSYMMGRLAIEDARRSAEKALGERFDVAGFHEAVLGNGTVSIEAMRWSVDDWVESSA